MHDAFVSALVAEVHKLRLGDGLDPATTQGPLISSAAVERVSHHGRPLPSPVEGCCRACMPCV